MSRNNAAIFILSTMALISGMIVINALAQGNGLREACDTMQGIMYHGSDGTTICFKE